MAAGSNRRCHPAADSRDEPRKSTGPQNISRSLSPRPASPARADTAWRALLEQHDLAVGRDISRCDGTEVTTTGDGFFARFD